jgi:hypothetical protein
VWGAGPTYAVLLDGKPIVQLGASETKTVQVPAGAYEVEVRCGGETPDTTAKAQIMLGAGRSYQMDVYQTIDTSKQQPICQLRPYPGRLAWRQVMSASAKWSMAR